MFNIRNLMCVRNKMKNLSEVSEYFPLWRGAGGGFSFTNNIIMKYSLDFIPNTSAKVRNQKLEIRMNAIIGAPRLTFNIQHPAFPITHYPLPITYNNVRNQKLGIRMNAIIEASHSTSNIQHPKFNIYNSLPITHHTSLFAHE